MSKSDSFENSLLLLLFNNTNIANVGDATGLRGCASAGTSLYVSLHTADPGEAGTQATNEISTGSYPNYARQGVLRASGAGGWTVTTNSVTNASTISFPQNTGSLVTATHVGVGTALSGAGVLLYSAQLLGTPIVVGAFNTSTDTFSATGSSNNSGFANGNAVRVYVATGGTLPTCTPSLSTATTYYIGNFASGSPDTWKLYTDVGLTASVDITAVGVGTMYFARDYTAAIGLNATPSFSGSQLTFTED